MRKGMALTAAGTVLAALLVLGTAHALAAPAAFASEEELGRWMTYYYKHPEPARLGEAVAAAGNHGLFRGGKAAPPFFGFIAGVLAKEPSIAPALLERLATLPESDQPVLVLGVWYSGHKDTTRLLDGLARTMPAQKAMIAHLRTGTAPPLMEIPLEQGPWVLDALWGYFMASGEEAPVVRIMAALPWIEVRGNIPKLSVGGAAKWSLTSNAVQHERVMKICKAQLARQPKEVAAVLRQVIEEAEEDLKKEAAKPR